ncbi:hypothetical protein [Aneurinibacillus sp. REN35]|uniref:hypothetical protein n=1 Tax=Aneurinibacillus sp. REN35 TaxID=3237286 RepID=UPI00352826C9
MGTVVKLLLIITGVWILGSMFVLGGLPLFDFLIHKKKYNNSEIQQIVSQYLQDKYKEKFIIGEVTYSRPLGDKGGTYYIDAMPERNKNLRFGVIDNEEMTSPSDDYKEAKWRDEARNEIKPLIDRLYPDKFGFMVNVGADEEIKDKYSVNIPYYQIKREQSKELEEYLFIYPYKTVTPQNVNKEMEKLFEIYQYLKMKNIKGFKIQVRYVNEKIKEEVTMKESEKNGLESYENTYRERFCYFFNLDVQMKPEEAKVQAIHSASDLLPFGRFLNTPKVS